MSRLRAFTFVVGGGLPVTFYAMSRPAAKAMCQDWCLAHSLRLDDEEDKEEIVNQMIEPTTSSRSTPATSSSPSTR